MTSKIELTGEFIFDLILEILPGYNLDLFQFYF